MPTKKILLRGISRTPSDRMSADGGLAESIGFEMNENELATSVPAVNVTDDTLVGEYTDGDYEVLYIHKTNSYNHYIGTHHTVTIVEEQEVHHKYVGWFAPTPIFYNFLEYEPDETVKEIKSVGNTLIILIADLDGNTKRTEYALFKNGSYVPLGDEIPEPRINCYSQHADLIHGQRKDNDGSITAPAYQQSTSASFYYDYLNIMRVIGGVQYSGQYSGGLIGEPYFILARRNHPEDDINYTDGETTYDPAVTSKAALSALRKSIYDYWLGLVNEKVKENATYDFLSWPRFIRYAVRLYDGTYVKHSAPIMICCPDSSYPREEAVMKYQIMYRGSNESETWNNFHVGIKSDKLYDAYYADFSVDSSNKALFEDWSDIISSVDVFISEDIIPFSPDEGAITDNEGTDISDTHTYYTYRWRSNFNSHSLTDEEELDRVLSKSNFYRMKELSVKEYTQPVVEFSTKDFSFIYGDKLVLKPSLADDISRTNDRTIPLGIKVYNERLLVTGAKIQHFNGYYELPSRVDIVGDESYTMAVRYYIKQSSGTDLVVEREYSMLGSQRLGNWLYYPDPRCYKCVVTIDDDDAEEYEMKEHPYLNGAYCLIGFEERTLIGNGEEVEVPTEALADIELRPNTIFQYGASNMFVVDHEQTFPHGTIVDLAVITKPLSTGQFGYSSLYVFTSEGLWALATKADGSIGNVDAVSQDVALPGTVCQLDQAVVFTTKKGVMLLTGSDLRCISDKMHGRHYKLDDSLYNLLMRYYSDWSDLAIIAHEDMPFMEFMKNARTAYDYVGRRLLFFNASTERPLCKYIYTYMLETDSWHKVEMPARFRFMRVLNSYPETFIAMDKGKGDFNDDFNDDYLNNEGLHAPAILSFSNARGQDTASRHMGMIVTRPIDLDEVDVRKVLNRLFVRGLCDKEKVRIILMGSMDGQMWQRLRSMRGGSYKQFRVVLLCELSETERISYLEAEYETRYGSRLR